MAVLAEQEYQLGEDGVVFGGLGHPHATTPYFVAKADWGAPELRTADQPAPLSDGQIPGRDWYGGRTISFDMNISKTDRTSARPELDALASDWAADGVRHTPRAVVPLRYRLDGVTRRVYGRPRNFAPVTGAVKRGWVPITADFVTMDHLVYDDEEAFNLISIAPTGHGGFTVPLTAPWTAAQSGPSRDLRCDVAGTQAAWLCFDVYGPIAQPSIEVVGQFTIRLDLALLHDQSVTIDPRPWSRSVRGNRGENWAGKLSLDSPALPDMRVLPAVHTAILRGVDPTGTAMLRVRWRAARASY